MNISEASIKDKDEIEKICKENDFELERNWNKILISNENKVYILKEKDKIIAFTGLIKHKWNNTLQILNIFVVPDQRKKGFGLKLIKYLIDLAKKTEFRCLIAEAPSNTDAQKLYEKAGFRKCGYNDRYYSNKGEPIAYWMSYDLK